MIQLTTRLAALLFLQLSNLITMIVRGANPTVNYYGEGSLLHFIIAILVLRESYKNPLLISLVPTSKGCNLKGCNLNHIYSGIHPLSETKSNVWSSKCSWLPSCNSADERVDHSGWKEGVYPGNGKTKPCKTRKLSRSKFYYVQADSCCNYH